MATELNSWEGLLDDLVPKVLSFLSGWDVAQVARVCKKWAEICRSDNHLWKSLVSKDFGGRSCPSLPWRDFYIHESRWMKQGFDRRAFRGHRGDVRCLQFDAEKIISGSEDCTIKIWDMDTGSNRSTISPDLGCLFALKYDARVVLAGGSRSTIGIIDLESGKKLQHLLGHTDWISSLDVESSTAASGSHDCLIKLWDVETLKNTSTLVGHDQWVTCLQLMENVLISGSGDHLVRLWDVRCRDCVQELKGHTDSVTGLQFDDTKVFSTSRSTTMLWDLRTAKSKRALDTGSSVCVRFDESRVVCGRHLTGCILILDVNTLAWKRILEGPKYLCSWCLEFDKENIVCGGGVDVEVWTLKGSEQENCVSLGF